MVKKSGLDIRFVMNDSKVESVIFKVKVDSPLLKDHGNNIDLTKPVRVGEVFPFNFGFGYYGKVVVLKIEEEENVTFQSFGPILRREK